MQAFDKLITSQILKKRILSANTEYRLQRPLKIVIPSSIIAKLKALYKPDYEEGGILELIGTGKGSLEVLKFHPVKNLAVNSTSYAPSATKFNSIVDEIIGNGNVPIAIHTHPIKIGFESYDSKRSKFFLRSSSADRQIARNGITDFLLMPEAIFTVDAGLKNGFGINLYEGQIFPNSITALSDSQIIIAAVVGLFGVLKKITRPLIVIALGWFALEFTRRPKYDYLPDETVIITLNS